MSAGFQSDAIGNDRLIRPLGAEDALASSGVSGSKTGSAPRIWGRFSGLALYRLAGSPQSLAGAFAFQATHFRYAFHLIRIALSLVGPGMATQLVGTVRKIGAAILLRK